jgi:hypothetical protein
MTDDDFEEEEAEPELDEESLDENDLDEEDLDEDEELDDDLALESEKDEEGDEVADEGAEVVVAKPEAKSAGEEDDEGLDLDEELHPDDVEEPLDVLLQERTATITLEDEDEETEEEEPDVDERGDGPTRIMPRRPGEFLCASCFLVLPRSQLADAKRMLCRDCA